MANTRSILGVEWTTDAVKVRVRDEGRDASRLRNPVGMVLNYRLEPGEPVRRWCVGHHDQVFGYVDCATELAPDESGRTCSRCSAAEAIFASQLHHAHTQPRRGTATPMGRHLEQKNILYLAGFRDGSVKVGTSTATRSQKRLLEQGAWQAIKVAEAADGYAVREIEDQVTTELGITQAVLGGRKLKGLVEPLADAELGQVLDRHARQVIDLVADSSDARLTVLGAAWRNPEATNPVWGEVRRYPLDLRRGSHDLEIRAIVGRMVAVARPASPDLFAIDLQKLFGVELPLGEFVSDEIVIQDSLF